MLTCGVLKETYYSAACCNNVSSKVVDSSLLGSMCESVYEPPIARSTPRKVLPIGCEQSLRQTGGTLYIYNSSSLNATWSDVIDLGKMVMESTVSCYPRSTPHMVIPSPSQDIVAMSYTADAFVHFMDVKTRRIVACLSVKHVPGAQIHTGTWYSLGGKLYFLMVDMTGKIGGADGGGGLHLWEINGTSATLVHSWSAPIALLLPTNETKPIAAGGHYSNPNGILFVTDAKYGGGYFVDITSGKIVLAGHVTIQQLSPGCNNGGGLWVYPHPEREDRLVAQYGTQSNGKSCLIDLDVRNKTLVRMFSLSENAVDAHGLVFCKAGGTSVPDEHKSGEQNDGHCELHVGCTGETRHRSQLRFGRQLRQR